MVFEICAAVITLLLVILTVYIILTLKAARESLKSSKLALDKLACEITSIREDLHLLLKESTVAAEKINVRINDFDPLLESLASVGRTLQGASHSFEARTLSSEWGQKKGKSWQESISDILELTSIGMKVFQQIQKRK